MSERPEIPETRPERDGNTPNSGQKGIKAMQRAPSETPHSLGLLTVMGIPIRIHYTFFLLLAWLAFYESGPSRLYGLLNILGIFTCVVLHELGHSVIAQRFGIQVSEIVLYPIGGVARLEKNPPPRAEVWIAIAGPAVNVIIAGLIYAILTARGVPLLPWGELMAERGHYWQKLLFSNILLVLFNLIPAFPMDGGRVLRALLAMGVGEARGTQIAASIGQILALGLGLLGLFWNPMLLFIAFFVFIGAGQEAAQQRGKAFLEGLSVREGMITDFRTLPVGATLAEARDLLIHTSQVDFPVLHGEEVVGVLARIALFQGLRDQGPTAYVAGSMAREFPVAAPNDDLQELVEEMQASQRSCVLIMEDGRLIGLVTMENIAELLILRQIMERTEAKA